MSGTRFSLKALLAAVTLAGVGVFALLNASPIWVTVVCSATVLTFLTALLALACGPSPRRAFWIGLAIFGLGYLVLTQTPFGESHNSLLPTHAALETLYYQAVAREVSAGSRTFHVPDGGTVMGPPRPQFVMLPLKTCYDRIGHCLWAWLLALIGGFVARHFYLAQKRKPP
jgi:hypothetical protein